MEKPQLQINIPTAYEEKYEKVEKILKQTLDDIYNKYEDVKKVEFLGIDSFENSCVNYLIRITCSRETQWDLKRLILKDIKNAYDKNNIKIPYDQLEVHNGNKL